MTESRAIKFIKERVDFIEDYYEEMSDYKDALEMAINALEKQIAKKVKIEQWIYTKCDCGFEFSKHHGDGYYSIPIENKTKYCPNCGQKLDFGE